MTRLIVLLLHPFIARPRSCNPSPATALHDHGIRGFNPMKELESFLKDLRSERAVIITDLIEGSSIESQHYEVR